MVTGLNFKLDVGLYRLDQQVACQRIDTTIDAKTPISNAVDKVLAAREAIREAVQVRQFATV
jgi:hypothetical protein